MRLNILLALALYLATVGKHVALATRLDLEEWSQYKKQHGKVYETHDEDIRRMSLFLEAKARIKKEASNELNLDQTSDWTKEGLAELNGHREDRVENDKSREESFQVDPFLKAILDDPVPLPAEVDWRKVPNRVSPVKDQNSPLNVGCRSCWAFAAVGALEGQQVMRNFSKNLVTLSEQQLVDCSGLNNACLGGRSNLALRDIERLGGIQSAESYPYTGVLGFTCNFDRSKSVMTISGSVNLPRNDSIALKKVVARFGPVAISFNINSNFERYRSGIFTDPQCGFGLNHGALVVGYGSDPEEGDYWIIKNSWGERWGEQGYIRVKAGLCNIGYASTIPKFDG